MGKLPIFVIQKHSTKHPHYDFRLEKDGVLKSWAVPKEPPEDEKVKRLAIAVDDHELAYAKFSGDIPEGRYGAGRVEIWDNGTYVPIKFSGEEVIFSLNGEKLNGRYCLIKMKINNPKGKNWLFFKMAKKSIDKE